MNGTRERHVTRGPYNAGDKVLYIDNRDMNEQNHYLEARVEALMMRKRELELENQQQAQRIHELEGMTRVIRRVR